MRFFGKNPAEVILWTGVEYIMMKTKQGEKHMNFNNDTKKLGFCDAVYETTAEQSLDADINLPDYCPEIQRILKCTVVPNVTGVQNSSGRVTAEASAVVRLVYVGDNGKAAGYEQTYPIQKFVESDRISSDCAVSVSVNTDYANCRAVSPRRVDVRAMLTFIFKALKKREENILCSAEGAGIQTMKEDCELASLCGICERAFSMSEVIELGADKSPVSQIINVSACACASEVKVINNKALIKGDCTVKIYYISDGNGSVESTEHSMPISQIIESDGVNENSISSLRLSVSSCEAVPKADSSGEMRLIDLNARISAFMAAFEETPLSLITDAYSTEYEIKTTPKSMEALKFNCDFNSSFTNKVVFESIGVSVDCVLAVWCSEIKYTFGTKDDRCVINGTYSATVIYRDSENQIGIVQKPVDFDYSVRLREKAERIVCFGSVQAGACSCSVTGDSRLEMKTEMFANGVILSSCMKKYIGSIDIDKDTVKRDRACALTIYFCDSGESLWNIARKYNTTVEAIMLENDLTDDVVEKSRMMLIPGA